MSSEVVCFAFKKGSNYDIDYILVYLTYLSVCSKSHTQIKKLSTLMEAVNIVSDIVQAY